MKVYACGNCGGALELIPKETVMVCAYCGFTNEKADLESELDEFKKEISGWLSTIGAVGGTGTDVAMRKMYFNDSVYPSLVTEFSNLVGDTEDIIDFPLCYLRIFRRIPDLVVQTKWNPEQGKPMKDFARKLESPELANFAPDPDSQWRLNELKFRSLSIPMLMDILSLAETPNAESFVLCSNTLLKLASEASKVKDAAQNSGLSSSSQYYALLASRLTLSGDSFLQFAKTIENGDQIEKDWLKEQLTKLDETCSTLKEIEDLSVTDRVSLEYGLDNDANAISAAFNLANLYPTITKTSFEKYITAVESLAAETLFISPPDDNEQLSWFTFDMTSKKLSWFLSSLHTTINRKFFRILVEPSTIGPWMKKKKSPTQFFLYPFYVLKVKTVLKSGFLLWKKGTEEEFISLCDAAFNIYPGFLHGDFPSLMTPGFKKMVSSKRESLIQGLLTADAKGSPPNWTVLPPSVSPENVEALYTAAHNYLEESELSILEGKAITIPASYRKMGFDSGKVKALSAKVIDLVFLPMVLEGNQTEVLGKPLGLECKLPHRINLCHAYMKFIAQISE